MIAPLGPVYQAGTLSGNPVAMAAGLAQLRVLNDTPELFYSSLNAKGDDFFTKLSAALTEAGIPHCCNHIGTLGCVFFTEQPVRDYASAQTSDTELYTRYFKHMLVAGIYLAPSQFEAMFVSAAHTDEDLEQTIERAKEFKL